MQTNLKGLETSYWKFQILKGTEKHKIIQFVQSTVRVKYMYLNQGNLSSFPTMSTLPLCLCSLPPHSFVFTTNTHTLAHLWHFNRMAIRHFSAFYEKIWIWLHSWQTTWNSVSFTCQILCFPFFCSSSLSTPDFFSHFPLDFY